MKVILTLFLISCCLIQSKPTPGETAMLTDDKIVIAHRGASGYLPEHTLEAKAMAYAMGADYIEQDVVMTKDHQLVVLHDPFLDRISNVMEKFPDRFRTISGEKRWLAIDFSLEEIRQLRASEGFKLDANGNKQPIYADRFPLFKSRFRIPTLAEEIELIQGLNKSTGKSVGIYVEIKAPWLHRMEGYDISKTTLELLKSYGYQSRDDLAYVQCFDPDETRRIREQLYPELKMELKLIQLIAHTDWHETRRLVDGKLENYSYDWLFESGAMQKVAQYADGIGPWYPMLIRHGSDKITPSQMLTEARIAGLIVHPFTFRKDDGQIPDFARDFTDFLDIFYRQLGVDGLFTDFPDLAVDYLNATRE